MAIHTAWGLGLGPWSAAIADGLQTPPFVSGFAGTPGVVSPRTPAREAIADQASQTAATRGFESERSRMHSAMRNR